MTISTYDPCFLIITTKKNFGIVGIQTDDTIILADNQFLALEKDKLIKTKFFTKPREKLTPIVPLIFNGCILTQQSNTIGLGQKKQGKKIKLIDIDSFIL
jgi:hypothetical protein